VTVYRLGDVEIKISQHRRTKSQVEWHVAIPCTSSWEPWRTHRIQVCDTLALALRVAEREATRLTQSRYKESL
jgi:hypothetical protein